MSEELFESIVKDAGIPVETEAMKARFRSVAQSNNIGFNNNSEYSPFWRLVSLLVITPTQWLISTLINAIMPNLFVKTAAGAWLDMLAWAVNVQRREASKASGMLTFTRAVNTGALTIPTGTVIQSSAIAGTVYEMITTEDVGFDEGSFEARAHAIATDDGSAWNLASGFYGLIKEPIAGVITVINNEDWLTQPGTDIESDEDLRFRARNQFSAINQYHTDAVYRRLIAEKIGIDSNQIYFEHGAPRGPGTANAYILFDAGVPTSDFIDAINLHIRDEGNHGHGDDLISYAMPETFFDITADIWTIENLSSSATQYLSEQVEFFIRTAFREATVADYQPTQTWPWSRFSISQMTREIHAEFPDISSITFNQGDIVSQMEIPRLNSLTVNMQ